MSSKEFRGKGYDTAVVGQWLLHELQHASDEHLKMYMLVWSADFVLKQLHSGDFLSGEACKQIKLVGEYFLRLYLTMAALEPGRWMVRPKLHMFHHLVANVADTPSGRSPHLDATWMDEDWLKKIARILKQTHKNTCARSSLSRYLLLLKQRLCE